MAQFLRAAGYHCLAFDVRGPRREPGRGAADHRRRVRRRRAGRVPRARSPGPRSRPRRVRSATRWARIGAILGGGRRAARRGGRRDVRARPIPGGSPARRSASRVCRSPAVVAWPLAWLTTRVYLRPRGHTSADLGERPSRAIDGPVLLVHGARTRSCPVSPPRRGSRRGPRGARRRPTPHVETLVIAGRPALLAVRVPGLPRAVARSSRRPSAGRCRRMRPANAPRRPTRGACPTRRGPTTAVEREPGGSGP